MSKHFRFKEHDRRFALRIAIWQYIVSYIGYYGIPPTVAEIADSMGFKSSTSVHRHLDKLEAWRFIGRYENLSRGILLLVTPADVLKWRFDDSDDEKLDAE